jgi:hypothetical protein
MNAICNMYTCVLIIKAHNIKILEFRTTYDFDDIGVNGGKILK